jgi:hypothetical protein
LNRLNFYLRGHPKPLCMQLLLITRGTSPSHCGCLSDCPQLPRRLWADAGVHDETCRGVHWNLMENILSTYYKYNLSVITHKLNVSEHMLTWQFFIFLVHKMLGSSRVAAQLAASQEGLSSMSEWVSEWNSCPKFVRTSQIHSI